MKARAAFTTCLCLALAGCAGYRAVDAQKSVSVGDGISVEPQVAWANAYGPGISGTVWTIDGLGLNELRFLTGIAPGKPLMEVAGVRNSDLVHYDTTMLPDDVAEMTVNTLTKMGYSDVRSSGLAPAPFGSDNCFRFALSATRDELDVSGRALAVQRGGKLDLVLFLAPAEYYYGKSLPVVEKILASISLPAK